MTAFEDRVQFQLARGTGDIFSALSRLEHPQWPDNIADQSGWTRAALRVLYARSIGSNHPWVALKDGKSEELAVREPSGIAAKKVDVALEGEDRRRVAKLIEAKVARNAPGVLRTALAFLHAIAVQLGRGARIVERGSLGTADPVPLAAIAATQELPQEERLGLSLVPPDEPIHARVETPRGSDRNKVLFAIVAFTHELNAFLAHKVMQLDPKKRVNPRELEERYDLEQLLREFMGSTPEADVAGLFPKGEVFALKPDERRTLGGDAVREYIVSRRSRLRPLADNPDGATAIFAPPTAWRHWARSRLRADGQRECDAPFELASIIHHHLANEKDKLTGAQIGDPAMTAHDLQTWLIDAFGIRTSTHMEALANACESFNRSFYGHSVVPQNALANGVEQRRTLDELYQLLKCSWSPPGGARPKDDAEAPELDALRGSWALFLYLFLNVARVTRPVYCWQDGDTDPEHKPALEVRSLSTADFNELRARIFGAQTAIEGLHWILRGGIATRANLGRAWLVTGAPGTGKSTLSMHIACDMARRGRIAIIVCTEERARVVEERRLMFGLRDDERYTVVSRERFERMFAQGDVTCQEVNGASSRVKGLLVVYAATAEDSELKLPRWLRDISTRTKEFVDQLVAREAQEPDAQQKYRLRMLQTLWRWKAVVVDSLDALELLRAARSSIGTRKLLVELMRAIEVNRFWGILLCGQHNPHKEDLTYLADTVIELGTDETGMHRMLQIHKCRTQPFDPGEHLLQLTEGVGIVLHPNLASTQRWVRRRVRPPLDQERRIPLVDATSQRVLWRPESEAQDGQDAKRAYAPPFESAIWRSSSLLLYGKPQTGKTPLLMSLLSQRLVLKDNEDWPLGANGSVLILSFRGNEQDYLRPLRSTLRGPWLHAVSDLQLIWYRADETMRAAQITHELVRKIQWARRDGLPFDWIVFAGIEALDTNLPAVDREHSFWPTILGICASEEITTAFVANEDPADPHGFRARYEQDMDYVVEFTNEGDEHVVRSKKSPGAPFSFAFPKGGGTVTTVTPNE